MGAICCKQRKDGQPTSSLYLTNVTEYVESAEGCVNEGFQTDLQRQAQTTASTQTTRSTTSNRRFVRALTDYVSRDEEEISFLKGDFMSVLDDTDSNWLVVEHMRTREEGCIPRTHVVQHIIVEYNNMETQTSSISTEETTRSTSARASNTPTHRRFVRALTDYVSGDEEISFLKGDFMSVLDDTDSNWLVVEHMRTREEGYIPRTHVVEHKTVEYKNMETQTTSISREETIASTSARASNTPTQRYYNIEVQRPTDSAQMTLNTNTQTPSSSGQSSPNTDLKPDAQLTPNTTTPHTFVIALWDYDGTDPDDLSFKKKDVMAVLDATDPDWLQVENTLTKKKGFIPRNHVAEENSLESMDWYHGRKSRAECNKLLMLPDRQVGTFLVRLQAARTDSKPVLSVRAFSEETGVHVIHYEIETLDYSGEFYIKKHETSRHTSIQKLVDHYRNTDGLCCRLTQSCPTLKPALRDLSKSSKDQWEIAHSELQLEKLLGHGHYGEVWQGEWKKYEVKVAIKMLQPGTMSTEDFLKEATIMKECNHDKLVRLLAVCAQTEPIYIVTELMCNGDLLSYLRSEGQTLEMEILVHMIAQVADGMAHLESRDYMHRDLAARNILVGESFNVKVADFGLARILGGYEYVATDRQLPVKWTALEGLLYNTFTVKSDVWSFAILVYEIVTRGENPYPGLGNTELIDELKKGYRMPRPILQRPDEIPTVDEIWKMQIKCWAHNPDHRPTFESLADWYANLVVNQYGDYLKPRDAMFGRVESIA